MGYVIKGKLEDFIVEEQANLPLTKRGSFAVYRLTKSNRNTDDVLQECARNLKVLLRDCAYGGRKDKYGITSQFITVRNKETASLKKDSFSLSFVGFMERPMGPDLIEGNLFTVVVRKLSEQDVSKAFAEVALVKEYGFASYFDDQRFGSYDEKQGFLAEKILKKEFNGALKIYLTSTRAEDRKPEKERKLFFLEHWRDWSLCYGKAETDFEKKAFSFLQKHPNGFLPILQAIPRHELSSYFSAFQSFLWNEIERRFIRQLDEPLIQHEGVIGAYYFYRTVALDTLKKLQGSVIPMPGVKVVLPQTPIDVLYSEVLAEYTIAKGLFNNQKVRTVYCKSFPRSAIVVPKDIAVSMQDDDVYDRKKKLVFSFFLPRGTFATMLIKRIFSA
ncbi:MAG TPA: tRNA pseudouridine(13) synthase TruD [Candidatus Omnitrophota bacterium]|nr:tRNA pseudouridine(13) synthase TruD [Candidatus Omnitrophota bacterium]